MNRNRTASVFVICVIACVPLRAQDNSREEMRSLDGQVQEIKTDVLTIARDLALLEERLLYPSGTQLSVFVELDGSDDFRLDAVRIEIDGTAAAHHIYSFKELEALQGGGVQRVYTGNIRTGSHQLSVAIAGKLASGRDFSASETFSFSKDVDPKLLGLTLTGGPGAVSMALSAW